MKFDFALSTPTEWAWFILAIFVAGLFWTLGCKLGAKILP